MTREEAIKILRDTHDKALFSMRNALETLIPELRESEDDKIREELIGHCKDLIRMNKDDKVMLSVYEPWLVYLEKQKELFKSGKGLYYYDSEKTTYCGYPATEENPYDFAMSQQEQKSIEIDFEDWDTLNYIRDIVREHVKKDEDFNVLDKWLTEHYVIQKPAEWSKNDTVFLNEITDFFENKTTRLQHDLDMYAHWLKSLPERFNLQPKQEWSEEDEEFFRLLHAGLYAMKVKIGKDVYDKAVERLKSLRPQPKVELTLFDKNIIEAAVAFIEQNNHFNCWGGIDKHTVIKALRSLKPHWKPSEEQMKALKYAAYHMLPGEEYRDVLFSLFKDLEKLM